MTASTPEKTTKPNARVEVQNGYVNDDRVIQQSTDDNCRVQQWRIRQLDLTSGLVRLYNRNRGKTFDSRGSTDPRPGQMQEQDTGPQGQEWRLVAAP
jgi:hypothetical protein